ncbi:MAG: hypothetical protein ACR2RV_18545 [Verrucomicrobiales bacterium]
MRQFLGLAIGLIIGVVGAILFSKSLPPQEGSVDERLEVSEHELQKAKMQIAALRAEGKTGRPSRTTRDGLRTLAEDVRAGRPVDLDDVFKAAKPWMRDMAPLFDRIRVRDQKQYFDTIAGEWTRKYDLDRKQQRALETWLDGKAEENAKAFSDVVESESTGFEDMVRATREFERQLGGLDSFMGKMLEGEMLEQYQDDRLLERVDRVQREADRKVQRLDHIVELDEGQKDEVFALMARSSNDFDPSMQFEGLEEDSGPLPPGQQRSEAVMGVLRPQQVEAYETHRREQIEEAQRDLGEIGLRLPPDWDLFDEDDF